MSYRRETRLFYRRSAARLLYRRAEARHGWHRNWWHFRGVDIEKRLYRFTYKSTPHTMVLLDFRYFYGSYYVLVIYDIFSLEILILDPLLVVATT